MFGSELLMVPIIKVTQNILLTYKIKWCVIAMARDHQKPVGTLLCLSHFSLCRRDPATSREIFKIRPWHK